MNISIRFVWKRCIRTVFLWERNSEREGADAANIPIPHCNIQGSIHDRFRRQSSLFVLRTLPACGPALAATALVLCEAAYLIPIIRPQIAGSTACHQGFESIFLAVDFSPGTYAQPAQHRQRRAPSLYAVLKQEAHHHGRQCQPFSVDR